MAEAGAVGVPLPVDSLQTPYEKLRPGPGIPRDEVWRSQRARLSQGIVEAVAEQGYSGVTIRRLIEIAGVSTSTFYKHFSGKEECFRAVHAQLAGGLVASISDGRASASVDEEMQVKRMLSALAGHLADDPRAAHFLFVAAGSFAPEQDQLMTWWIGETLAAGIEGAELPQFAVFGLGAGVLSVARSYLLIGRLEQLRFPDVIESLAAWVLSRRDAAAASLLTPLPATPLPSSPVRLPGGDVALEDRALLLSAVIKLAAAKGSEDLTSHEISSEAGLARMCFERHFTSAEECLSVALASRTEALIERAYHATGAREAPVKSLYRATVALYAELGHAGPLGAIGLDRIALAGESGVHRRDGLIVQIAELIEAHLQPGEADELWALASAGSFWSTLEAGCGATERARRRAALAQLLMALPLSEKAWAEAVRNRREQRFLQTA